MVKQKSKHNNHRNGDHRSGDSGESSLKGKTSALGSHVYVFGLRGQGDKYITTTDAIAEWAGRNMTKAMRQLILGVDKPPEEPEEPTAK